MREAPLGALVREQRPSGRSHSSREARALCASSLAVVRSARKKKAARFATGGPASIIRNEKGGWRRGRPAAPGSLPTGAGREAPLQRWRQRGAHEESPRQGRDRAGEFCQVVALDDALREPCRPGAGSDKGEVLSARGIIIEEQP